ncbi:hypothetical protein M0805_007903 [Coniferiporia weirii]|nr:hypothetical protein M0805_007903 [Coniferiporia weirii]
MSLPLESVERALLAGQWDDAIEVSRSPVYRLAQEVVRGEFSHVLTSPPAKTLLNLRLSGQDLADGSLHSWFSFDPVSDLSDQENELLRLVVGVACLHAFIQANWTGPDLDIVPTDVLFRPDDAAPNALSEDSLNQKAVAELAYGGEPAYHLACAATFLRLAQLLFDLPYALCQSALWWRLRVARVHLHVLDDPVAPPDALTAALEPLYAGIAADRDLAGRLALEHGLLAHTLGQDRKAAELFVQASRHTGLEYELTGALGKRTKFQQTDLSQLVLLAESRARVRGQADGGKSPSAPEVREGALRPAVNEGDPTSGRVLPETLALNDDTLLEQTAFTSSSAGAAGSKLAHLDPSAQPPLDSLDQCILLSLCLNVKNTSPAHGLTTEQMAPYVVRVVAHPQNWSVHTVALLLRSRLEAARTRTVERSTLQLQALVDQMPSADAALSERLRLVHALPLPSKWELERELALRFLTLGVVRSALQIFERLEMWEEAVKCWQALERPAAGIEIVRDLLEGRKEEAENVVLRGKTATEGRRRTLDSAREAKLWCLLGDLESQNALEHYERAWTISGEKSGRAMRSMGGYHFTRSEFAPAIGYLKKAVAINPLLVRPWFILGCSCVREERWEEARDAFTRCVSIDDEDSESWNNLASVYLRMSSASTARKGVNGDRDSGDESRTKNTSSGNGTAEAIPFTHKLLAFRALKIGLKHSYTNWRMWTNYMIVAMDVGEFAEAAHAQARVVEERAAKVGAEAVDEDLLDRLVGAVTRALDEQPSDTNAAVAAAAQEANGGAGSTWSPNEGAGLRPRVLDLFERTILPRISSQRIYRAYARLLASQARWTEAVKYHLDVYRLSSAATMEKGGEVDRKKWLEAVVEVEEIVDVLRNFGPRSEKETDVTQTDEGGDVAGAGKWKMQARSIVRSFAARTRDSFEDDAGWEKIVELQEELKK